MDRGYVKLWRKSMDSQVWVDTPLWKVWTWCLMKANHTDKWVSVAIGKGTTEVKVDAGQFVFGRGRAATELRMPKGSVYDRMKKLEAIGSLNMQPNTHYTLVTLCNWALYAASDTAAQQAIQQPSNSRPTAVQQPSNSQPLPISAYDDEVYAKPEAPPERRIPSAPSDERPESQHIQERRKKKGRSKKEEASPSEKPAPSPEQAQVAVPSAVPSEYQFDTVGKGAKSWTLPQPKLDEYVEAYPHLDVPAEIRKARQWIRAKPKRRKTAGGMLSFLTGWLNRSQDRGGAQGGSEPPERPNIDFSEIATE